MPRSVTLRDRIDDLQAQARALRARVQSDGLRARLDEALLELERIPELFPEPLAWHALLVPQGRIRTVREILAVERA